jgi:succinate-semialdehyde dehydrogenase / glutarate-semialdehyde dehydrogenase
MMNAGTRSTDYPALKFHIDGEWVAAGRRRKTLVVNPATCEPLGELAIADIADLDRALNAAERSFRTWRHSTAEQRAGVLRGAARLIRERIEEFAAIATREEGKPLAEARIEAGRTADLFDFFAGECSRLYGRVLVRPSGERSFVTKEPVGPVAAFAPWNFPIANVGRKLGAAIAAGCSIILKPAEETPGSALAVLETLVESGLPSGVAQVVFGIPDEISRHLLASPIIRKVSFTGSTAVGKHLLKLAADTVKRATMELGGHAPVIVFDDADVQKAVDTLASAKFRNAGQVCVAPTRFYVQQGVYDRFVTAFSERAKRVRIGDGLLPDSGMGPMANPRRPMALEAFIKDAVSRGGRLHTGGERHGDTGYFWRPTLLSDVPVTARIMNEEPFGPVATVTPFATFDEAVEHANRLPFGLAAYAFTENGRRGNLISDAIESGMVGVNTARMAAVDAPFQGVKQSGYGSEEGPEGVEAYLLIKTIHLA